MQQVNVVISSFQPFTLGHLKCATNVFKSRNLKTVYCVVDTTKPDEKHPFLTKMLWSAFKSLVHDYEEIQDFVLIKNADIIKMAEACAVKGYTIATWSCGSDRYNDYLKMCRKYAPEVEVIEIHREESDISATQVREAIKKDKKEQFEDMTPKQIHKLWDKLKEAINALN